MAIRLFAVKTGIFRVLLGWNPVHCRAKDLGKCLLLTTVSSLTTHKAKPIDRFLNVTAPMG